jgi:hypothetical protein
MAKKSGLTKVAVSIGAAVGKADRKAHETAKKVSNAGKVAKQELASISKEVESLKKRLQKATSRLQKALS